MGEIGSASVRKKVKTLTIENLRVYPKDIIMASSLSKATFKNCRHSRTIGGVSAKISQQGLDIKSELIKIVNGLNLLKK